MTDEQQPPEQPIVAMRDLSPSAVPADPVGPVGPAGGPGADPAYLALPLPNSRRRMVGALLLLLSAVCIVAALLLPLYTVASRLAFDRNGAGGLSSDVIFQINLWGLTRPSGFEAGDLAGLQVLTGPTPRWGIPLVVIAALLVLAGGAYVWRWQAPWTMAAMVGSVALFTGCVVAMATFVFAATQGGLLGSIVISGVVGPSFWVLVLALVLALCGAFAAWRNQPSRQDQPVERVEPDTPALGFPMPDPEQGPTGN